MMGAVVGLLFVGNGYSCEVICWVGVFAAIFVGFIYCEPVRNFVSVSVEYY